MIGFQPFGGSLGLLLRQFWRSPDPLAALAGGLHPGLGALGIEIAFELRERVDDPVKELSDRGGRVDLFGQGPELDPGLFEQLQRIKGVAQGAEGAVHLPDHERIAGAEHLQGQREAGPDFGDGGDAFIFKDAHAARAFERVALKVEMLFVGADPRIADNRQIPLPPVPCRW